MENNVNYFKTKADPDEKRHQRAHGMEEMMETMNKRGLTINDAQYSGLSRTYTGIWHQL